MKLPESMRTRIMSAALQHFQAVDRASVVNLQLYDEVLERGESVNAGPLDIAVDRDSAMVFADLAPQCNWAHPAEVRLFDASTGAEYHSVPVSLPPPRIIREPQRIHAFHTPVERIDTALARTARPRRGPRPPVLNNVLSNSRGQRYALLFAGHAENRHTNDLEFLYRTLIDVYAFDPANIYVLNHDGTLNYYSAPSPIGNWPGNNTPYRMNVTGPGTRAGIQAAFNTLAGRIQREDLLLIHTNNHGGGLGDDVTDYCMFVYDALAQWIPYYVNDFITDLSVLPRFEVLMVMMEQCRSGGFIDPILNNTHADWTHVATAVAATDYSLGGDDFDPFAEDWIAGLAGANADGTAPSQTVDTNSDGRVSAAEAFAYADAVHTYDGRPFRYYQGIPLRLGDTPTFRDAPAGYGAYVFAGLPAHDLYLRDNLDDDGREPLVRGGISCSPDIIVYNDELLDPEATLGSAAAQASDMLGETVEIGQPNYIYLRVHNRGMQACSGTANVWWAPASTLPTPGSWNLIAQQIAIPSVAPGEMSVVGPIEWTSLPQKGHYCFIGTIESAGDPAPNPNTIQTIDDYYRFIRESNNATWKNFNVDNVFKDSVNAIEFNIDGWPSKKLNADLNIDLTCLPQQVTVFLKIPARITLTAGLENATLAEASAQLRKYQLGANLKSSLRNLQLKAGDHCKATLEIAVPQNVDDGVYRLSVAQVVGDLEMGRITRSLKVGQYPYMGNSATGELHVANCEWAERIGRGHKVAYTEVAKALKRGYNGCRFCLTEYDTD